MGKYKISDLENLTGVKSHTIRIWEQRYKILTPLRSETNIRYYDDEQLRKLLNVVSLMNSGTKISAIGKLSTEEINERVSSIINSVETGVKEEMLINQMISAGLSFDEVQFDKAFSNCILSFGVMDAYQKVFYPMLNKIGLLWTITEMNPSQEHFISNLVKQKIYAAIDALNPPKKDSEKWVLFLPEGEQHELGLLIANYALRSKGTQVYYLGQSVPVENLNIIAKKVSPTHFLTFSVRSNQQESISRFFSEMEKELNNPNITICCNNELAKSLTLSNKINTIISFEAFQDLIS
jgi:DNA-binding transcriptional MerR regulator